MRNFVRVFLILAAAACGSKDHGSTSLLDPSTGAGGAGGTEGTGGSGGDEDAAVDEPSDVIACGAKSCNAGEYCCDGACGACVAIGSNCPADPCGTDGAAADDGAAVE
jgi:hypothetical protein